MKLLYALMIVVFACSHEDKRVTGIAISQETIDVCAHAVCPMIYCENSLPPIPSQGICCQRCVTNPECNATACPKYKCVDHIIPANFSAGECCDRCAPATTILNTESTTASVRSQEDDKCSSSSEERILRKQQKIELRLIRLLTETLSELRRYRQRGRYEKSSDSEE